jgi:hypothetical protein
MKNTHYKTLVDNVPFLENINIKIRERGKHLFIRISTDIVLTGSGARFLYELYTNPRVSNDFPRWLEENENVFRYYIARHLN